jgi:hypothetical protein
LKIKKIAYAQPLTTNCKIIIFLRQKLSNVLEQIVRIQDFRTAWAITTAYEEGRQSYW